MDELRILNGLHRGATLPLQGAPVTLGNGEEADMVLADHGIEAYHALIEPDGAGGWRVLAQDGAIEDSHHATRADVLALGYGEPVRLGASGIWLALATQGAPWSMPPPDPLPAPPPDAAPDAGDYPDFHADDVAVPPQQPAPELRMRTWRKPHRARRWLLLMPLAILASLGAVGAYAMVTRPALPRTPEPRDAAPGPSSGMRPAARIAPPGRGDDATALAAQFRQRLAEAELLPRFELDLQPGLWTMHADLDSEEQARFERILAAFVEQHRISFPVNVKVVTAEGMLPFAIEQVVSGANPSVVTRDGRRLYVGDDYMGVRVAAIEAQHVSFVGKRKIEVNW